MRVESPAKLNLFLQITGVRPDGYHDIQTLFKRIDCLHDTLQFAVNASGKVVCNTHGASIAAHDNLVVKAALKLQELTGCKLGCSITLHKTIPTGGGLGGGSSNAASTLLALNTLWQLSLSPQQLLAIALSLGADVPFFVSQLPAAWATGVGEQLQAMPDLAAMQGVLLLPHAHIATQALFKHSQLNKTAPVIPMQHFDINDWWVSDGRFNNCFTELVLQQSSEVATAFNYLRQFGLARLTGTGAGVFVAFPMAAQVDLVGLLAGAPCPGVVF